MGTKNIPSGLIFTLVVIAIIIFFFRTSHQTSEYSGRERAKNLSVEIFSIDAKIAENDVIIMDDAKFGSGIVFWRDGYILTAAHVVTAKTPRKIFVSMRRGSNETIVKGTILAVDADNDIAAIRIKARFFSEVPLGDDGFEPWEKVYSYNCLHGACGTYIEGNFLNHGKNTAFGDLANITLFDMFIAGGASGGGIFDRSGNMVALVKMGMTLDPILPSATAGINTKTIHKFLTTNRLPHRHSSFF